MQGTMSVQDLALVRGIADTRATLKRWSTDPGPVIGEWAAKSLLVACALLLAVYVIATVTPPDPRPLIIPGVTRPPQASNVGQVLFRNSLVLALHGFACVAGFIAGSSMPLEAARRRGTWKVVHDWAGTLAIWFVILATGFSLATQALILGGGTAAVAAQLEMSPGVLLGVLSLHAVPELTALFLPLAAWLVASRRGQWSDLLAATFVTVAIAVPVLVASAFFETYVTPDLIRALSVV